MERATFASSLSTETDSELAIEQAIRELALGLGGAKPDLLVAFVSHDHASVIEGLGERLSTAIGARTVIGCAGESIVGTEKEVERGPAIALWAGVLPNTKLRPFTVEVVQQADETLAFSRLPVVRDPARASLLMFADPFSFPMSEYLEVLNQKLPGVPAVGGMASGGTSPGQNFLFTADGISGSGAVGLVIEGDVEVCSVVSQGCRPVGRPFVITACKDNFILKLGGKSAVQVLMDTLHELSAEDRALLQSRPFVGLAVDAHKSHFDRADFLVRGLIGIEPQQGALAVNDGSIRVGMTVQFLVRDAASAGEDLSHLMRDRGISAVPGELPGVPSALGQASVGALVFSCNGRGTRMFATPNHDIACVQSAFDAHVPAAGFLANGEIGPIGGRNFLHGFTASVAVFRPRTNGV
jgi:small ligand-binding sensory domain FIST